MKKIVLASTVILALSAGGAFAQSQPNDNGASSNGNVGPGTTSEKSTGAMKQHSGAGTNNGMTTGAGKGNAGGDSSASGNVGPGTSNNMNRPTSR